MFYTPIPTNIKALPPRIDQIAHYLVQGRTIKEITKAWAITEARLIKLIKANWKVSARIQEIKIWVKADLKRFYAAYPELKPSKEKNVKT